MKYFVRWKKYILISETTFVLNCCCKPSFFVFTFLMHFVCASCQLEPWDVIALYELLETGVYFTHTHIYIYIYIYIHVYVCMYITGLEAVCGLRSTSSPPAKVDPWIFIKRPRDNSFLSSAAADSHLSQPGSLEDVCIQNLVRVYQCNMPNSLRHLMWVLNVFITLTSTWRRDGKHWTGKAKGRGEQM